MNCYICILEGRGEKANSHDWGRYYASPANLHKFCPSIGVCHTKGILQSSNQVLSKVEYTLYIQSISSHPTAAIFMAFCDTVEDLIAKEEVFYMQTIEEVF